MEREGPSAPPYQRLVVKLGTNLITGGRSSLSRRAMESLVGQVAELHREGLQIIVVSSGAVAAGRQRLGIRKKRRDTPFRQTMAAVGQSRLMQAYDRLFGEHNIVVAQTLLTKPDFLNRLSYLNARNTLLDLLQLGVVPIVNENDVTFVEELEGVTFGDNDNLSAMVASLVDADLLIVLSDVAGLYAADPNRDPGAELISKVDTIDASIESLARGPGSDRGTGGMATKLEAARLATSSGTAVVIAAGREPDVIIRLARGENIGTFFAPSHSKMESRKRWMLSQPPKGKIIVDPGARTALRRQKRSLLAAGITDVTGSFGRGDIVSVHDSEGRKIGCGIANYSAADIQRIKGVRSERIQEILGYGYGDEVIHRDNLTIS